MALSSRQQRIARRAGRRAVSALREPAVLLLAALGVGVAWAIQLPFALALAVGAGMIVVAAGAKVLTYDASTELGGGDMPALRSGTEQAQLVAKLRSSANQLEEMVPTFAGTSLGSDVMEAATGAKTAVDAARRLAGAADAIDDALSEIGLPIGGRSSPQMDRLSAERRAAAARLRKRKEELLARIEAAYLGAAEVRVKLLEVSAALQAPPGVDLSADTGLAAVSKNLESLRRGLEELETTAKQVPNELEA